MPENPVPENPVPENDRSFAEQNRSRPQFGLTALLWTTFVAGLALAYLKTLGSTEVFIYGLFALVIALVLGVVSGVCSGRIADATYWALMIATGVYVSVVNDRTAGVLFQLAWVTTGASAGSVSGSFPASRPKARVLAATVIAGIVMLLFAFSSPKHADIVFDIIAARIIGGFVGVLVQLVTWVEQRSSMPRYVTAAWLLAAVIAGNLLVPYALLFQL